MSITYKFVDSLEEITKVKNSVYQISKDSFVINENMMVFSCLASLEYELKETKKIELVLTCKNRNFTCTIKK